MSDKESERESQSRRSAASAEDVAGRVQLLKTQAMEAAAQTQPESAGAVIAQLLSLQDAALLAADPSVAREVLDAAGHLLPTRLFEPLEQLYLKAAQVLRNHAHATVADWFVPLYNLGILYEEKGDNEARNLTYSRMVQMADRLEAPLDEATMSIFAELAGLYEGAAHPEATAILYRQLHRAVHEDPGFSTDTRVGLTGKLARALAAAGRHDAALAVCEQTLPVLETGADYTVDHGLQVLGLAARLAQEQGDMARARLLLERGRDVVEPSPQADSSNAGTVYHNLATLYIHEQQRDRYDEAERLLKRARDIVAANGRRNSSEYAGEVAQLARLATVRGEPDRAAALFQEAFRLFETAADTDLRDYAAFLTSAGFLYLQEESPEAIDAFRRAQQVYDAVDDLQPLERANAYSNLATAHFECRAYDEAIRWYRKAIDLRHECRSFLE